MAYIKIAELIDRAAPKEKIRKLTPEQIKKIKKVSSLVLSVLAIAGIVSLAVVAPNILAAVGAVMKSSGRKPSRQDKITQTTRAFYYLKRSGLVKFSPTGKEILVSLSELGKKKFEKLNVDLTEVKKSLHWNGKWWQVAADVPTKNYRQGADRLRRKLKDMKFYPLQRTLWIYPYDPRKEIEYLSNYYGIGQFVTVMEIKRMDKQDEEQIMRFFKSESII